jgi:hypothetical protein
MTTKLKRCPFCGREAVHVVDDSKVQELFGCDNCLFWFDTLEEWNTRSYESERDRAMDALFPKGWEEEDAENIGSIVEGVCETMANDIQEIERLNALFESLTPGGSEFHDSPDNCVAFVTERLKTNVELVKKNKKMREVLEAVKRQTIEYNYRLTPGILLQVANVLEVGS